MLSLFYFLPQHYFTCFVDDVSVDVAPFVAHDGCLFKSKETGACRTHHFLCASMCSSGKTYPKLGVKTSK